MLNSSRVLYLWCLVQPYPNQVSSCYYLSTILQTIYCAKKPIDLRKLVRTLSLAQCDTNLPNCREFSNERTRVERRETFRKLRMKENFSKAFEGYFQWIIRAGEISNKKISNYHLNIHCLLAVYRLSSLHIYTYIYI